MNQDTFQFVRFVLNKMFSGINQINVVYISYVQYTCDVVVQLFELYEI